MKLPAEPPTKPDAARRAILVVFLLAVVAGAGWYIRGQLLAFSAISNAKAALARGDMAAARSMLEEARKAYPSSDELAFLLGQTLRREGEFRQARRMLDEAKKLGWVKGAIALEEHLMLAQGGNRVAEAILEDALDKGAPVGIICEVLVPAALSEGRYDVGRAATLLTRWQEEQPDDATAWAWSGRLAELHRNKAKAIEAYKTAVELRPRMNDARRALVRLLLDQNLPAEAGPHLDVLLALPRKDDGLLTLQARLLVLKGEAGPARTLLDGLLAEAPDDPALLHLRGRLELDARDPKKAAEFLEKAMKKGGYEPGLLSTWIRCLEANSKDDEVKRMQARLKGVEADLARAAELTRQAARSPKDPEPRGEIGELYLRIGQVAEGMSWLNSALAVSPNHPATHKALAAHYARIGRKDLADHHRAKAAKAPPKLGG